ncbi:MAG: DNA primase [Phycisphaerales bacterium]
MGIASINSGRRRTLPWKWKAIPYVEVEVKVAGWNQCGSKDLESEERMRVQPTGLGNQDVDRVLAGTDLVRLISEQLTLKRSGREHVGLCPFHDDTSPSMRVVTHKGMHFFKCFACGESGNAIGFAMKFFRMEFGEALRFLAERAGIELTPWTPPNRTAHADGTHEASAAADSDDAPSRSDLIAANHFAHDFFKATLAHPKAGEAARLMIENRAISSDMVERFGIGAAPASWEGLTNLVRKRDMSPRIFRAAGLIKPNQHGDGMRDTFVNRLIFPIYDQLGRPIAFGGRRLDEESQPKYLNSPETLLFSKSRTLYGFHLARHAITQANCAIVTEGYTDVIAMHASGYEHTIATLGTALTLEHAAILKRQCERVILLFDGDQAGQAAADRAVAVFFAEPIDVDICILPEHADPADLLARGEEGKAMLDAALNASMSALDFLLKRFRADLEACETITARQNQIEAILERLADLGLRQMSGLRKRLVMPHLAHLLDMPVETLLKMIPVRRVAAAVNSERKTNAGRTSSTAAKNAHTDAVLMGVVSQSRQRAELDFLSILIFDPEVRNASIDVADGHMLPLAEAFAAESFADPGCRSVFEVLLPYLESDTAFTPQMLCNQLESQSAIDLVMTLYFRGAALCEHDESQSYAKLADAAGGLNTVRDREMFRTKTAAIRSVDSSAADAEPAFLRILRERRQHGDDPLLLPRGVRS